MGTHLIDGKFQSDKHPGTPPNYVPLKITDPDAQPLLNGYAVAHALRHAGTERAADAMEFCHDLRAALKLHGFRANRWRGWFDLATTPLPTTDALILAATDDERVMVWRPIVLASALAKNTPDHLSFPAVRWRYIPGFEPI